MCNTKATLHMTTANLSLMKAKARIFYMHKDYYNHECTQQKEWGHTQHRTADRQKEKKNHLGRSIINTGARARKAGSTDALCPQTTHQSMILRQDTVATKNKKRQQNVLCTLRQRAHTASLC